MPACFSQLIVVLPTYQTVEVLLSPPCQGHLSGANAHAMPTQCPRNAHAMPTQCPRNSHAMHRNDQKSYRNTWDGPLLHLICMWKPRFFVFQD
jgi:hypothetical protein